MSMMPSSARRPLTSWLLASSTFSLGLACTALFITPAQTAKAQQAAGEVQTWVDETGQHKIQAKFLKIDGANVLLQTPEGKQIPVPYAKLSLSSQLRAKKLADPQAFAAPPLPSTETPPPLAGDPFPADPTIEQFLDTILSNLKEGHAEVFWHAMPKGAQSDVEAIVVKSAEILGPKLLKQIQAVAPNILTIVRDKRSFIVSNPRLARQPEIAKGVNIGLQASEPVVELLTKPSTWSSENFKQGNVGPWLALFSNDLLKALNKTADQLKASGVRNANAPAMDIKSITYKVIEKTADKATVEITGGAANSTKKTVFKKVDGRWIDDETEKMFASFAETRSQLESMDKAAIDQFRAQMSTGLTFMNGFAGSLASASTAQEFNALIEPYMGMIDAGIQAGMANARAGGPGMASPGMPGPGPGGFGPPSSVPRSQPPPP